MAKPNQKALHEYLPEYDALRQRAEEAFRQARKSLKSGSPDAAWMKIEPVATEFEELEPTERGKLPEVRKVVDFGYEALTKYAGVLESHGMYSQAAKMYKRAGDMESTTRCLRRAGDFDSAERLIFGTSSGQHRNDVEFNWLAGEESSTLNHRPKFVR